MQKNYPTQYERELDSALKADMAYSDERAFIQEVLDERKKPVTATDTFTIWITPGDKSSPFIILWPMTSEVE